MFSKPKNGWTTITLKDFTGIGSYLTDIPFDILNALINCLKNRIPASVIFDEEGSDFTLVLYFDRTYIITERKDKSELINIDINFIDLVNEIINDLESNIDEWTDWLSYYDFTEKELSERKIRLEHKISELKTLIRNE